MRPSVFCGPGLESYADLGKQDDNFHRAVSVPGSRLQAVGSAMTFTSPCV